MDRTTALDVAHDLSLAAWFGGAWMGAVGLNGATIEVDDHTQRIRVANAGWFRWAPIAATALATNLATAVALNRLPSPATDRDDHPHLQHTRTALTAAAVLATAATGAAGRRVVRAGDVPVATATTPIQATPDHVARAQRLLRYAQWLVPALTAALWVVNTIQRDAT